MKYYIVQGHVGRWLYRIPDWGSKMEWRCLINNLGDPTDRKHEPLWEQSRYYHPRELPTSTYQEISEEDIFWELL